jgi:nitrate reductase NapE component
MTRDKRRLHAWTWTVLAIIIFSVCAIALVEDYRFDNLILSSVVKTGTR